MYENVGRKLLVIFQQFFVIFMIPNFEKIYLPNECDYMLVTT